MANVLNNSYKQYKEDTTFIAGWLAEKSIKCGYELTTVGQKSHKVTGRLKGKARKQVWITTFSYMDHADECFGENISSEWIIR